MQELESRQSCCKWTLVSPKRTRFWVKEATPLRGCQRLAAEPRNAKELRRSKWGVSVSPNDDISNDMSGGFIKTYIIYNNNTIPPDCFHLVFITANISSNTNTGLLIICGMPLLPPCFIHGKIYYHIYIPNRATMTNSLSRTNFRRCKFARF